MFDGKTAITLRLGYSGICERSNLDPVFQEFLDLLFGDFSELRFHVEQFSFDTMRLTVRGSIKGLQVVHEQFTGIDKSVHTTKKGTCIAFRVDTVHTTLTVSFAPTMQFQPREAAKPLPN